MSNSRFSKGTGRIALCGLFAALSLALLWAATIAPSGRIGVVALAGLVPAAAVVSAGLAGGFLCYGAVSILGLILLPDKICALLYLLFFGLYPMVKSLIERRRHLALEIILKLLFFNLVLAVVFFGLSGLLLPMLPRLLQRALPVFIAGNLVFLVYDYGFSKIITYYAARIHSAAKHY